MFCCARLPDDENEIEPQDDISFMRCEGNGLLSVYQSILAEQGIDKLVQNFFPHLKVEREPILDDSRSIRKLFDYLHSGVNIYYENILDGTIDDFEANSMDSVFALLIVGLHYGLKSHQYANIKDLLFKTSKFDLEYLEIPIKNVMHLNKTFHVPEKTLLGNFYDESKDPNCYRIPETCTIALFSDWATGTLSSINLAKEVAKLAPDYVIHLGDVYYSGTISETKSRLVEPIKKCILEQCPQTRVFMIPGNHDYYSGTKGVKYALKAFGQNASFFSLYNSKVQIEGLDTGFNDSDCFNTFLYTAYNTYVEESELEWHENRINKAKSDGRNLIFLSHHQPISPWYSAGNVDNKTSPVNPKLFGQFKFCMNNIDLWLFGHDHSFSIMDPYTFDGVTLKAPRLIGNGACQYREESISHYETIIPGSFEVRDEEVPRPVIKNVFPGSFDGMLNNTFVLMNLSSDSIRVTYYEIPQFALGIFGDPKIMHYEDIFF